MTSQAPIYDPSIPTLADLQRRIEQRADLPHHRRRDMASAIRTLANWFNLPEANVPASAMYIRERLKKVHALGLSVSQRRVQNVRSLVLAAMREAGFSTKLAPYSAPLDDEWQQIWEIIDGDTYAKSELSRFARFCSHRKISPKAISDEVSQEFLAAIEAESLIANPKTRHQSLCRVWNKMADQHRERGWPQVKLTVPRYDDRLYRINESLVPPSIIAGIDAYLRHLSGKDVFAGLPKPFRPTSIEAVEGHLWRYISALHHDGFDLNTATSLDDLITPELVKRGLQWHLRRNNDEPSKHIGEIAWALRCFAVKYRIPDEQTADFFSSVMPKLRVRHNGLSTKNEDAMKQFDDPEIVERFLLLPHKLWNIATGLGPTKELGSPRKEAELLVQTAIAIEILQFAPMRIRNLNRLRLDAHLQWQGEKLRITIPADEVKNSQQLDFLLSGATTERISRYIKEWRCLFLPASNPYLFPGRDGQPKDETALRRQIENTLWKHAAIRLTPHQFRHAAAKIMLDARPGHYEVVRKVLGHKSMATTYNHYAGAETQAAIELYGDIITERGRAGALKQMKRKSAAPDQLLIDPLSPLGKSEKARR